MNEKHEAVLCSAAALAAKNADVNNAIANACLTNWSDGQCSTLAETYDYIESHRPNDLERFIDWVQYLRVG